MDFNRDIRPILSENCFTCHGPDEQARKAKLRLDQRNEALKPAKSGATPVVPGHPDQSEVIKRIRSTDDDEIMPPRKTGKRLAPAQMALLTQWVQQGAAYAVHWAFVEAKRPELPKVRSTRWPREKLDWFILARIEREGLSPSHEASRTRWLRRVTYDLTGLPPSSAEVTSFLADRKPDAFERVVDRLVNSPHFGERLAVPWLDAARYADSYGYQSDQLCPTWPYRDWVVQAFNENVPYDQFILQQLAGDLLPHATRGTRLATAFNRLHRQTNEGGSIAEEWRSEYVSDRVHTLGTAFLGLTFECARCHDHKYDPITMRDYYSLASFLNNIDEAGLYNDAGRVPTPSLLLPNADQETAMKRTAERLEELSARVQALGGQREIAFNEWLAGLKELPAPAGLIADFDFDVLTNSTQLINRATTNAPGSTSGANRLAPGRSGQALEFTGDDPATLPAPGVDAFRPWDAYSVVLWIWRPAALTNGIIFHRTDGTDVGFHGVELSLEEGRLFFVLKRFWPGNAIAVRTRTTLPAGSWAQIAVTFDGSGRADGMRLYVDGRAAGTEILRDHLFKSPGNGGGGLTLGQRFRSAGLKGGRIDDARIYARALAPLEVAHLYDGHALTDAVTRRDASVLRPFYLETLDPVLAEARSARREAVRQFFEARDTVLETMVMEERPGERPTYVLARGRYDAPTTEDRRVTRTTPAAMLPMPSDVPPNRLGLARWLTRPEHPLTARVAVNRFWQMLFGKGLVTTTENFGLQGSPPSHPELLDWLARDFIDSGWDVKAMLRRLVLSATYRQNSALTPRLRERDPENRLWARGPSHRLPAEMIRDTALAASGLLDEDLGGPPVSPYQPGDLWRESNSMSPAYHQSLGTALYRRSLYTVWKRTAPMPNMVAFDAPSREVCVVKRSNTGTPQQAYVLLNDPQFVEAARVLAERMMREGGAQPEPRIQFAFQRLTGRAPDKRELELLKALPAEQRGFFTQEPDRATKLIQVGDRKPDPSLNPVELAAHTALVQTILNLDATVWKR